MTEVEAIELLKHHSFTHDDIENIKSEKGFLGMLRPYQGELYEDNFHEVMEIIKVLKNHFYQDKIDTHIISNFWGICHYSRAWALDKDSMLRRNNLISDIQLDLLTSWIECISNAIALLLEGLPEKEALENYRILRK